MNISAPFIARPVATTLLTIGIALAGIFAFFKLPVSPLPQVDFPTISVQATLPGASPETVASSRRRAAGTPPRPNCRCDRDDIHQFGGVGPDRAAVRPGSRHQRRGARCAGGDQRRPGRPADHPAQQSDVLEGQSGGRANRHPRTDLADADGWTAVRRSGERAVANAVADQWRRSGHRRWRGPSRRAGGAQPDRTVQIRHRARRCAGRAGVGECRQPERVHRHSVCCIISFIPTTRRPTRRTTSHL